MAVNGKAIQSYSDGMTAYLRVRRKRLIWIDVVRQGEPLRLDFLLVEEGAAELDDLATPPDPTALVEQELALDELSWLKRRKGRKAQKTRMREAEASTRDLDMPGMRQLGKLGDIPRDD
jgi:hypothetical protein